MQLLVCNRVVTAVAAALDSAYATLVAPLALFLKGPLHDRVALRCVPRSVQGLHGGAAVRSVGAQGPLDTHLGCAGVPLCILL